MVRTLNPPTPRTPPKTHSEVLVTDHEKRVQAELAQLVVDIRRIGPTYPDPSPHVLFGELFDDEDAQQYYEALVGTLKSAKKRGIISFKGQMLLKGMHDKVTISLVGAEQDEDDAEGKENDATQLAKPPVASGAKSIPRRFSFPSPTVSTSPPGKSPIVTRKKAEIAGTCSDTEAEMMAAPRSHSGRTRPPLSISTTIAVASDSETDTPRPRRSPRGRIVVPSAFSRGHEVNISSRPPAPWRIRKAKSEAAVTKTDKSMRKLNVPVTAHEPASRVGITIAKPPLVPDSAASESFPSTERLETRTMVSKPVKTCSLEKLVASKAIRPPQALSTAQSVSVITTSVTARVEDEVHHLVKDISRVGANPGEPSVTFGELFDDEHVQQTYEALVQTLRSARRQGYIDFKGQMLFKGMHDNVVIHVVDN